MQENENKQVCLCNTFIKIVLNLFFNNSVIYILLFPLPLPVLPLISSYACQPLLLPTSHFHILCLFGLFFNPLNLIKTCVTMDLQLSSEAWWVHQCIYISEDNGFPFP